MNANQSIKDASHLRLGLDIGSISVNTVLLDSENTIIEEHYDYCHGQPFNVLRDRLSHLIGKYGSRIGPTAITGTGGKHACELIGGGFVNEIVAESNAVSMMYPDVKSVISMGGEDSKLFFMEKDRETGISRLVDFKMNSICAAGTGSFLDQQAKRIGVSIDKEFGELALQSEKPPRIAGRCSVFAKSDMIHYQQIATPVHDIVAGLCFAVARNFKSNIARGKDLEPPVLFQGGVAANVGVVRAFKEIVNVSEEDFIIADHYASMGAFGAIMYVGKQKDKPAVFKGIDALEEYLVADKTSSKGWEQLTESEAVYNKHITKIEKKNGKLPVYLGIDVGSLSTNLVLIDEQSQVVARKYLPTASRPLDAICKGLSEIYEEVGEQVEVKAAGTTGSGRYLTGDFIGADVIHNEITAQATAAIAYDPTVDTIFEIGGQDSKYISIDEGVVVDFEMNKVCAAGTGSFLEEQAEKLEINIVEEFGELALGAKKPAPLGDRCTVFMESDLNSHQQKGETTENLVSGLAYSIVYNYLQKVVGDKPGGDHIFFQGGVTNNKGVVAAFEQVTGKKITIPPHFDVTGAIGMAMIARDTIQDGETRFKGFGVRNLTYSLDKFTCKACSNYCEIRSVKIEGNKKPLFYGGRCERYEKDERKSKGRYIPNLFNERTDLLLKDYDENTNQGKTTIGIPRSLMTFYQRFPFWNEFFTQLGFQVVLSRKTDPQMVSDSLEMLTAETCFPIETIYGHVKDLEDKNVDHIFLPFVVNSPAAENNPTANCNCPWIQTYPFMIRAALKEQPVSDKLLIPTLHFRHKERALEKELAGFFKEKFNIRKGIVKKAIDRAFEKQNTFEDTLRARSEEIINNLPEDKECLVILGRPYNTSDPELNLRIAEKLKNLDVFPIPVDYLPVHKEYIFDDYDSLYWPNGQKILAASRIVAKNEKLHAIHMSNFRCGPDSFLSHYIREEMKGKPYANIEVDEHSADAGVITRVEAFLDSLKGSRQVKKAKGKQFRPGKMSSSPINGTTLYIPYMNDSSYVLAATLRSCGIDSYALPMQNEKDLEIGRKYTSSKECFPMISTTGSFIKKLQEPGTDPSKTSFFMPDHNGPCRFGQYNKFQRIIFDRLGYDKAEIVSPSNDGSYEDITGNATTKFRANVWKGFVIVDLFRKLLQERRPYELVKGTTNKVYYQALDNLVKCIENDGKNMKSMLRDSAKAFDDIPMMDGRRKPVVSIVGEIFMRDNAFCNGFLINKLESLGAETLIAPFSEWLTYSTYRYIRDSKWKGDKKGLVKAKIQEFLQNFTSRQLIKIVEEMIDHDKEVGINEMLEACEPYVHKDYDGDPALALGAANILANRNVSGIVNVLPFTCMPGTLICAVSGSFKKDHNNIPWVDYAYDGQDDPSNSTRLQAFMYQVNEYANMYGYDKPDNWAIHEFVRIKESGNK
ncbi:MAG: acyl-CoA dehydratase activase [Bacteroidales bacterium]